MGATYHVEMGLLMIWHADGTTEAVPHVTAVSVAVGPEVL